VNGPVPRGIGRLARLPAAAYGMAVRLRNFGFDRGWGVEVAPVPVASVGNLTLGGTGKTPLTAWLCRRALESGRTPAVVSRGYGGRAGAGPVVVSRGSGPEIGPETAGDEPVLLARMLPGVRVVVGSNRAAGARRAAELGADLVVLDDGFQHRRLRRDLDVVLVSANDPFGGGSLLPAGRLREPVDSLRRASVVVVTRCDPGTPIDAVVRAVRDAGSAVPVIRAGHRPVGFVDRAGSTRPAPERAIAFCAIGDPAGFRRDLERTGVRVDRFASFRDHHPFRAADLEPLIRDAEAAGAALVTTEKDLVRLSRPDAPDPGAVIALRIEAVVHEPEPLVERLCALGSDR